MISEFLHSRTRNPSYFISERGAIKAAAGQCSLSCPALRVSNKTPYKVSESSKVQELKAITLEPQICCICEESIF